MKPAACKLVALCLALAILAVPALLADVTVRYKAGMTSVAPVPGMDLSSSVHIKGNNVSSTVGGLTMIIDAAKQEVTIIDAAHKTFATVPASEYSKAMAAATPEMPDGAMDAAKEMLAKTKTKVESRNTGRTEVIQGIQAAERETVATIEMPLPEGAPAVGMRMNMTVHTWIAKPEELLRMPALRELASLSLWQQYFMDPKGSFLQLGQLPGEGGLASLADAMRADGAILRLNMEMSMDMPALAMPGRPGATAGTPMFQMTMEVVELSAAPLEDSLFQIPAEYAKGDFAELMKDAMQNLAKPAAAAPATPAQPRQDGAQAYVPQLSPIKEVQPVLPAAPAGQSLAGQVELLATLDRQGNVTNVEALAGPQILRQPAIDAVKQWKYRPVLRAGKPVVALTNPTVFFEDPAHPGPGDLNFQEEMTADDRLDALKNEMPRSPQQVLADVEQDASGREELDRFYKLDGLAKAALGAGATEKAAAYATELLAAAARHPKDWNYGNAIFEGNTTLGLLAVRKGDLEKARQHLLASVQMEGSPQLGSFGPGMALAKELLDKGQRDVVLEYLTRCRTFWKMGAKSLDAWSEAIRNGKTPDFGVNMR